MEEQRIHVHNADVDDAASGPRPSLIIILATVAAMVVTFGLVTARPAEDETAEPAEIDAIARPAADPGFRHVATIRSGPWDPYRVSGAYLFESPDGPVVITDDDTVSDVELPGLEVLFGAIPTPQGSLAFGRSARGPTLWWSDDNLVWTEQALPWDGTVRAAAVDGDLLTLIGIETDEQSFSYVVATRRGDGWLVRTSADVPDSHLVSIPGGFIGRGQSTDGSGSGIGYLFSSDGLEWTFQSERAAGISRTAGIVPSFVIDEGDDVRLQIADDPRQIDPPAWPISGLWVEGDVIWIQTPDAAWSSMDGDSWEEFPIEGVDRGYSVLLPVGDVPRIATVHDGTVSLLRWDPGTPPAP